MIDVMVNINNHRNGLLTDRISGLCISGVIDLEPVVMPAPRFTIVASTFSVHRVACPFAGITHWVGNSCWDSLRMKPRYAARLVVACLAARCRETPVWSIQSATGDAMIEFANRYRDGGTVTVDHLLAAMAADNVSGAA